MGPGVLRVSFWWDHPLWNRKLSWQFIPHGGHASEQSKNTARGSSLHNSRVRKTNAVGVRNPVCTGLTAPEINHTCASFQFCTWKRNRPHPTLECRTISCDTSLGRPRELWQIAIIRAMILLLLTSSYPTMKHMACQEGRSHKVYSKHSEHPKNAEVWLLGFLFRGLTNIKYISLSRVARVAIWLR